MLKLKLQYIGHLMKRADSLQNTLTLGKLKAGEGESFPLTRDFVFQASLGIKLLPADSHYLHIRPLSEKTPELACLPGLAFCPHSLPRKTQTALPAPGRAQVTSGSESSLITDLQRPCVRGALRKTFQLQGKL